MLRHLVIMGLFLGVYSKTQASELSLQKPEKSLRFFVLDYHSAATADIINIFETLGHQVVCWTISPYSQRVFAKDNDPVEIISHKTWRDLNLALCDAFY